MNTKTHFAPAILFPLPMHHGVTVLLMTVTALAAVSLVVWMIRKPRTAADGLF